MRVKRSLGYAKNLKTLPCPRLHGSEGFIRSASPSQSVITASITNLPSELSYPAPPAGCWSADTSKPKAGLGLLAQVVISCLQSLVMWNPLCQIQKNSLLKVDDLIYKCFTFFFGEKNEAKITIYKILNGSGRSRKLG